MSGIAQAGNPRPRAESRLGRNSGFHKTDQRAQRAWLCAALLARPACRTLLVLTQCRRALLLGNEKRNGQLSLTVHVLVPRRGLGHVPRPRFGLHAEPFSSSRNAAGHCFWVMKKVTSSFR